MRGQDRRRLSGPLQGRGTAIVAGLWLFAAVGAAVSQSAPPVQIVPPLTGRADPMALDQIPPLGRPVIDDVIPMRNYPEQPPIIPHSIDGYQLTVNTNRCLDCHKPEMVEGSGAPMISVTHFQDRDGQVLTNVTPRRYFCTACHVQQTDVKPLIRNNFRDSYQHGGTP